MKRSREPDLRLLCERCGYHLKGLKRADVCPECGKPVAESLPENRMGSAWQRGPGFCAWWKTGRQVIRHPVLCWDDVRIDARDGRLLRRTCDAGAIAGVSLGLLRDFVAGEFEWSELIPVTLFGLGFAVVYRILSWIEGIGIGLISRRRGWRLHRGTAKSVLAHASFGWVLCSIFSIGTLLFAHATLRHRPGAMALFFAGGFSIGLLVFETLVYIGMQKLKYANAPGSEKDLVEDDAAGATTPYPPTATGSSA